MVRWPREWETFGDPDDHGPFFIAHFDDKDEAEALAIKRRAENPYTPIYVYEPDDEDE
jgi:hypothetical protein